MSSIIYEGEKFELEFQEYHPPLWLSFWNTDSFFKKYLEITGEDLGFIYVVRNGGLTGFMESGGGEKLFAGLNSKINRSSIDEHFKFFSNKLNSLRTFVEREKEKPQTTESLVEFFVGLETFLGELNPYSNASYMLSKVLEEKILAKLKHVGYAEKASAILAANSQPIRETFSLSYKRRLLEVANRLKMGGYKFDTVSDVEQSYYKTPGIRKLVDSLVEDYFCLCSLNSGKRDAQSFFPDIFEAMHEKNKKAVEVEVPKEVVDDIYIIRNMIYFKDECSTFIPPYIKYAPSKIWERTASYLGVPIGDLDYLLVEEIISSLVNKKSVVELIEKRKEMTLFVHHPHSVTSVTEGAIAVRSAGEIIRQLNKDTLKDVNEIVGKVGARGHAVGKVRKILSTVDLDTFVEGEILVTVYTGPEFVPAMKKALAIVTDTGGITCHAAIVSRELGTPCVVGTKIATRVLKDGDLVEVDATRGVVTILKRTDEK